MKLSGRASFAELAGGVLLTEVFLGETRQEPNTGGKREEAFLFP